MQIWLHAFSFPRRVAELARCAEEWGFDGLLLADQRNALEGQPSDEDFIDRFAVAGPAGEVTERLRTIGAAGIDRLIVVPGSLDAGPAALEESNQRFASEVLPRLSA